MWFLVVDFVCFLFVFLFYFIYFVGVGVGVFFGGEEICCCFAHQI